MTKFKRESLDRDETDKLISILSTGKEKLLVYTLLDTGLRIQEFCDLSPKNIQWQESRLVIHGKNTIANGSGEKKRRVISMSIRVKTILAAHFAINNDIGISPRVANYMMKNLANRAGITKKCHPHILRHTFAVQFLQRGGTIGSLMKILGHSDMSTTAIYLEMSNEEACREMEEIQEGRRERR